MLEFFGFLTKLLRLLLKVNKITAGNQNQKLKTNNGPKQHNNFFFFAQRAKKKPWSKPSQEQEVGPRSRTYLTTE